MTAANVTARRGRWLAAAILALALGLRLAYVAGLPPGEAFRTVDARGYLALAQSLLARGSFCLQEPTPSLLDAIRTPLYPAFLALIVAATGTTGSAVPVAHAVVDTATAGLVYGLAANVAGARRGRIALGLYAVNPVSFLLIGEALSEVLLACMLALAFLAFVLAVRAPRTGPGRGLWLALAGLACGLCILCKPNIFLLPLLLAAGLLAGGCVSRRAVQESVLLAGVALLAVLPWLVRNRLVLGEWFLSLAPEANLAHISAVATLAQAQGEQVAPWTPRWEQIYMEGIVQPAADRYHWQDTTGPLTVRQAIRRRHDMAAVARDVIGQHPVPFAMAHLTGVARSFVPSLHRYWYGYIAGQSWPEAESISAVLAGAAGQARAGDWSGGLDRLGAWWARQPRLARGLWLLSVAIHAGGYVLVALGLWSLRARPALLVGLGLTMAYFLVLPGPIAYIRFWLPIMPLACVAMACAGLSRLESRAPGMRGPGVAPAPDLE